METSSLELVVEHLERALKVLSSAVLLGPHDTLYSVA